MARLIAHAIRRLLTGGDCRFTFTGVDEPPTVHLESAHLYIHVPFCRNTCPYCPYYKEPYRPEAAHRYAETLRKEIALLRRHHGSLKIPSIYFGGGTPALLGEGLAEVIRQIRSQLAPDNRLAIELRPEDCTAEGLQDLKNAGITQVSVGVQSFQPELLAGIGRNYAQDTLDGALMQLRRANLAAVNADMMFALPGQTMDQLADDARRIVAAGVDQVTCYPLFTFPYTAAGRHLRHRKLRMPALRIRRKQYQWLWDFFVAHGYKPVSVWSFLRGDAPRYSSVTRDVFVGLGAGAATCVPGHFWFNPFDLSSYASAVEQGKLPGALYMPVPRRLADLYWLYWRLYETRVPQQELARYFPRRFSPVRVLLNLSRMVGWSKKAEDGFRLTQRGAFWIHLAQNHFLLESIDRFWSKATQAPHPAKIKI